MAPETVLIQDLTAAQSRREPTHGLYNTPTGGEVRRTLVCGIALLWGATQAMAADLCTSLQGHSLGITGNGYHGGIGPNGITPVHQNGTLAFQTTAQCQNEPTDLANGTWKDRHLTFTRTRQGNCVQTSDGWIFANESSKIVALTQIRRKICDSP
jgi:hypothetical protein